MAADKPIRLTEAQREALQLVYSPDDCVDKEMVEEDRSGDGIHPRTLRSLKRRGLIVVDPETNDCEITDAGQAALDVVFTRKPRSRREAIKLALTRHAAWLAEEDIHLTPRDIPAPTDDDGRTGDYSEAVAAVSSEYEVVWSVVARMVTEAGWPICADAGWHHVVAFWPDED